MYCLQHLRELSEGFSVSAMRQTSTLGGLIVALALLACNSGPVVHSRPPVGMEFTSASLRVGGIQEYRLAVTVFLREEDSESIPDGVRTEIQRCLDETTLSVRSLGELYSKDIADRIQIAINTGVGKELVKEVRVREVLHTEYELQRNTPVRD